MKSVTTYKE